MQLPGDDTELTGAIRERCRSGARDLGGDISVARLAFDATVRRMKLRRRAPAA